MSEFILRSEAFKLGFTEKVPMPDAGECFLLYQVGGGQRNSFVIYNGIRYSSTAVRHGRYNQKATISLQNKFLSQNYRVVMVDNNFYYNVVVKISYTLKDVQEYFFEGQMDKEDILRILRNIMRDNDAKWDMTQEHEMQRSLENEIERDLKRFKGVKFSVSELTITPDEAAERMRKSDREKTVGIHDKINKTDEKIADNEQKIRQEDSEKLLKMKEIENLAYMMKNFGNMAPIVEDYLKGGMSGVEFYDYILKAKNDHMSMLNMAVSNDMLTQEEAFEKLNEILSNNGLLKSESQQLPNKNTANIEDKNERNEEEKTEDEEKGPFLEDGDYI